MVILLLLWRAEGYHQSAVGHLSPFIHECRTYYLNSRAKSKIKINLNRLPRTDAQDARYKNQDNDPRGPWTSGPLQRNEARDYAIYPIFSPTGKEHWPPKGTSWRYTKDKLSELISENRIWFGATGNNVPRLKRFLNEVSDTIPATTWWDYAESGHNDEARREAKLLQDDDNLFSTPKPERILKKIITMGSNPGDLVLDSFLGSGTTAAVAHKMGRRYIGIEMGEHAKTHCIPRLQKVIEGEQGGISQSVEWQGGGGFGFYTLHPEPVFQANGQIRPDIKFEPLAAYIWHMETSVGSSQTMDSPLLGVHNGIAYYLLYNGILGDRRSQGGNVLTRPILAWLQAEYPHDGPKVIYGESIRIGEERLAQANVTFKQIPYDVILR